MADVVGSKIDSVAVDANNFDMDLITLDGGSLTTFVKLDSVNSRVDLKLATKLSTLAAAVTDTDKFLVSDSGVVKFRTGAELLSDIGGSGGSGTAGYLPKWSDADTLTNSIAYDDGADFKILRDTGIVLGEHEDLLVDVDAGSSKITIAQTTQDADILIKGNDGGSPVNALAFDMSDNALATFAGFLRAETAQYRRYYHLSLASFNPGASGATWVSADSNQLSGFNLDALGEVLELTTDVHSDWDAASDLDVEITFTVPVDNSGGAGGAVDDVVRLVLTCYYKGEGETSCKSQTITDDVVIGACAQYTQFEHEFTIDYDAVSNVVEAGDIISMTLNMVPASSDVSDVNINDCAFYYHTTHVGIESGDA